MKILAVKDEGLVYIGWCASNVRTLQPLRYIPVAYVLFEDLNYNQRKKVQIRIYVFSVSNKDWNSSAFKFVRASNQ